MGISDAITDEQLEKLAKILKDARSKKGWTIRELASKDELITTTEISVLENGKRRKPDPLVLKSLANVLDLNYLELYKILGYVEEDEKLKSILNKSGLQVIENEEFVKMPVYASVSAGEGVLCYGEILYYDYFPKMKNIENKFNIKVVGKSMEPMIPDGAVVTIDKQPDLENGQIGVFLINGDEGIVKKFYREDKFIRLVSINPAFKDIIILEEDKEEFIIVGKVIKVTYLL